MPTFGYTTKGTAGQQSIGKRLTGSVFTCPEDGVAESISAYINSWSGSSRSYRWAIYRHSDGALIGLTEERTTTSDTEGWMTLNFPDPKPQLSANTQYVLCGLSSALAGTSPKIYYDNGEATEGHYQDLASYNFPDPANFTHEARKYSIYCTYTPSGVLKTWSATLKTVHFVRRPFCVVKLTQTLNIAHIFLRHQIFRLTQALKTIGSWTLPAPAFLKQWLATLQTTHVFRRPYRTMKLTQALNTAHVFRRPFRFLKLTQSVNVAHVLKANKLLKFITQTLKTIANWIKRALGGFPFKIAVEEYNPANIFVEAAEPIKLTAEEHQPIKITVEERTE